MTKIKAVTTVLYFFIYPSSVEYDVYSQEPRSQGNLQQGYHSAERLRTQVLSETLEQTRDTS